MLVTTLEANWDPACQLVVDAMHCILKGVTSFHVCDILCLTTTSANVPDISPPTFVHSFQSPDSSMDNMSAREVKQVKDIHTLLTTSVMDFHASEGDQEVQIADYINLLTKQLMSKNTKSLQFVINNLHCQLSSNGQISQKSYVNMLVKWVSPLVPLPSFCLMIN